MIVSEVFGPTVQGEGPRLGRRCGFVRLMACNLSCRWCDTPYTWDASRFDLRAEGRSLSPAGVMLRVDGMDVPDLVVSGGEPLLHQKRTDWDEFMVRASENHHVTVETNGTIAPTDVTRAHVDVFSVSPKLAHSGDPWPKRLVPRVLIEFARLADDGLAYFKFVAQHLDDLIEVDEIVRAYSIPEQAVWIMPEGVDAATLQDTTGRIADAVIARRYNLTTRLHVLTWGNRRGV